MLLKITTFRVFYIHRHDLVTPHLATLPLISLQTGRLLGCSTSLFSFLQKFVGRWYNGHGGPACFPFHRLDFEQSKGFFLVSLMRRSFLSNEIPEVWKIPVGNWVWRLCYCLPFSTSSTPSIAASVSIFLSGFRSSSTCLCFRETCQLLG
jgi:hypothetical protein